MKRMARWLLMTIITVGASSAWATPKVSLVASPFQSPGAGNDVVVAAAATDVVAVTSMDLTYAFDPALLTPTGVFPTAFTSGFTLSSNLSAPGVVAIHLQRQTALSGSGDVAWVTFHVAPDAPAGTAVPLPWIAASFNGGAIQCVQQGTSLAIASSPVTISTPKGAFGPHSAQVVVPISAGTLSGGSAFDLTVMFNPNVLTPVSVSKTPLSSCLTMVPNISVPGTVRVSLYGLCNLLGAGPLVNITFNVIGPSGSRTPLNVTRGSIDEDNYPTVLQDGLFNVCGTPDSDGDGYSLCAGDCNDASAAVHPGAVESCNSVDDNCNGVVDDAVAPTGAPVLDVAMDGGDASLSWAPVATATAYDVVRGDLSSLAVSSGGFPQSTNFCLADNVTTTQALDGSFPAEGDGYWYLVRPANCGGAGSFDGADPLQAASRDAGIDASPYACP